MFCNRLSKLTQLCTVATVDIVQVVAVLACVIGVCVVEAQSVPAGFDLWVAVLAVPVAVAAGLVREKAGQIVRTDETLLIPGCRTDEGSVSATHAQLLIMM